MNNNRPTADFATAAETINSMLAPLTSANTTLKEWVAALERTPDGQILAASLAIDLRSGAVEASTLATVLAHMDAHYSQDDAVFAFESAGMTAGLQSRIVCGSCFHSSGTTDSQYVRVTELGHFVRSHLIPWGFTADPGDIEEVRSIFDRVGTLTLNDSMGSLSGRKALVWVAAQDDVDRELAAGTSRSAGHVLNDALGLGYRRGSGVHGEPEFVAVRYPRDFADRCSTDAHQPTSLDATWIAGEVYYISTGRNDGWGRTHSCSGTRAPIRERVHMNVDQIDSSFSATLLGPATPDVQFDPSARMREAYTRLTAAI
jgi:hypothetical protein